MNIFFRRKIVNLFLAIAIAFVLGAKKNRLYERRFF